VSLFIPVRRHYTARRVDGPSSTRGQNSQDTSAFYFKKHLQYQLLIEPNDHTHIHPFSLVAKPSPSPFSPRYTHRCTFILTPVNQVRADNETQWSELGCQPYRVSWATFRVSLQQWAFLMSDINLCTVVVPRQLSESKFEGISKVRRTSDPVCRM